MSSVGKTETAQKLGGFQGLNESYEGAKANGFKGSMEDFLAISSIWYEYNVVYNTVLQNSL